ASFSAWARPDQGKSKKAKVKRKKSEVVFYSYLFTFMNIAVFLPNWVGDAVMATPAVRALRRQFPQARLFGVLRPYVAGVLEGAPWLDGHLFLDTKGGWDRRWPAVAGRLRRERVDLAVLFPNSFRAAL